MVKHTPSRSRWPFEAIFRFIFSVFLLFFDYVLLRNKTIARLINSLRCANWETFHFESIHAFAIWICRVDVCEQPKNEKKVNCYCLPGSAWPVCARVSDSNNQQRNAGE